MLLCKVMQVRVKPFKNNSKVIVSHTVTSARDEKQYLLILHWGHNVCTFLCSRMQVFAVCIVFI